MIKKIYGNRICNFKKRAKKRQKEPKRDKKRQKETKRAKKEPKKSQKEPKKSQKKEPKKETLKKKKYNYFKLFKEYNIYIYIGMVNYFCTVCGFKTTKLTNYDRHLKTKKHSRNMYLNNELNMHPDVHPDASPDVHPDVNPDVHPDVHPTKDNFLNSALFLEIKPSHTNKKRANKKNYDNLSVNNDSRLKKSIAMLKNKKKKKKNQKKKKNKKKKI